MTAYDILVTADSFLPHSGGSRVYYANLYKNLIAQYPDVVTILTRKVPGWQDFDAQETTPNFIIRRRLRPLPNWKVWQLPKAIPPFLQAGWALFKNNYSCLHCGDLFPQAFNGVWLKRLFGVPLLVYCHGDEISQTDQRRHQPKVRDFIYRNADAIVAANQFSIEKLRRIGIDSARLHKITPGVDLEQFEPKPRKQELIDRYGLAGKMVLLTVARLVPRKGHALVLRALPAVISKFPNVRYLIAGSGPEYPKLQQMATTLGLSQIVTFLGDVEHSEITDIYNVCDVFVMVNRLEESGDVESFGMVFTEAGAMGKPVIGGRSGGTFEAVLENRTGYLVDPNSAEELSHRIETLLSSDQLRMEMGNEGRKRVITEFSWKSRATDLREITADLAAGAKAKRK